MGTDSTQTMDILNQGMGMIRDLGDRQGRTGASADIEAQGDAREIRREAADRAQELREERERGRARSNVDWGGSGLAMSGSKRLVRDARLARDRQDEEDVLLEGDQDAEKRLRSARTARRDSGQSDLGRSLLSMGSKIYRTGS